MVLTVDTKGKESLKKATDYLEEKYIKITSKAHEGSGLLRLWLGSSQP